MPSPIKPTTAHLSLSLSLHHHPAEKKEAMATSRPKTQLCLLLFSLLTLALSSISASELTVYEILPKFGLPSGLLPDSVTSYNLSSDGSFIVELEKTCYIQFDYLVYYEKKITGTLKMGSISDLDGIEVQRFFFWFDVDEIKVDLPPSNSIYFKVGIITKELDIDQFETVHSCRDNVNSVICGHSSKQISELPTPVDEDQMLITE